MKYMNMKLNSSKLLLSTILASFTFWGVNPAQAAINKAKLNALWKRATVVPRYGFVGKYVDNQQVEARVLGLKLMADIEVPYSDKLKVEFSGGTLLETGSNSSYITNEYAPSRIWIIRKAEVTYSPLNAINLEAGALSQSDYNSPLLLSGAAFLGVRETLNLNISQNYRLYVKLQQSIPNNINLVQRIGVVQENGTPYYFNEALGLELKGDLLGIKVEASKFRFQSLGAGMANISRNFGNSITSGNNISSRFIYAYGGYNTTWNVNFSPLDGFEVDFYGQFIYNEKAPDKRNTAHLYGLHLNFNPVYIKLEEFRTESDASIAYYNSKMYSHNNHRGMVYKIGHKIEGDTKFEITYVKSRLIEANPYQSNTEKVIFNFMQEFE